MTHREVKLVLRKDEMANLMRINPRDVRHIISIALKKTDRRILSIELK